VENQVDPALKPVSATGFQKSHASFSISPPFGFSVKLQTTATKKVGGV
jgi:hypothetical protein